jgi:hypothetical protein
MFQNSNLQNKVTYNNSPSKNNLVSTFSPATSLSPKQTPRPDSKGHPNNLKPAVMTNLKKAEIREHLKAYIAQQSI